MPSFTHSDYVVGVTLLRCWCDAGRVRVVVYMRNEGTKCQKYYSQWNDIRGEFTRTIKRQPVFWLRLSFFYIAVVVAVVVAASLLFLHHIEFVLMCVSFRTYRRYIRQPNEVSMYFEWSLYVVDCFLFLFSSSSLVIFFRLFASRIVYHFLFMLDMACCVCIPWTETHR